MKLYLFQRFSLLQLFRPCKSSLKCASTVAPKLEKKNNNKSYFRKRKSNEFFTPALKSEKLQELNTICSISFAMNHVSWAKVSVPDLILLDWNTYALPPDFLTKKVESNYSLLANTIRENISSSELYVIENQKKWSASLNEINLRAMLIFLLSYDRGLVVEDKVIFQKPSLLNYTHGLLVGNERKSTRSIVKEILQFMSIQNEPVSLNDKNPNWYSELEIPESIHSFFNECNISKQESLSLALLIILCFINQNYFENMRKIQEIR